MSKARELANLGNAYSDGALSNRNLIINGAMQVAQRGTSTSGVTSNGYYASDRFQAAMSSLGTWTISQETDAPTGFKYSHKYLCTVADASPAVNDYINCNHPFETQDVRLLGYGLSTAKKATLSFWVKSNKTGTASVGCFYYTGSANYFYSQPYTINSADTWEYKTVTINPNTSNGFRSEDTLQGFTVEWFLNGGSSKTGGSHDAWSTSQTNRNPSNLGLGGAVNDYWQITGVMLEIGDTATPFEHRSYGDELARCKRYFERFTYPHDTYTDIVCYNESTSNARGPCQYSEKRAAPTFTSSASAFVAVSTGGTGTPQSLTADEINKTVARVQITNSNTTLVDGGASQIRNRLGSDAHISLDAEL